MIFNAMPLGSKCDSFNWESRESEIARGWGVAYSAGSVRKNQTMG
ncbi:MAG: hypothetical protein SFV20_09405 [Sphingopyxis sp.]|nr:hypothetical protein [Sphingopyxis sp.]